MRILIINAQVVNEGIIAQQDVFVKDGLIAQIGSDLRHLKAERVIDANGKYLLPGIIDDQVHFREPGLTHKATIGSEARAAVAGGTTSFMEMPNTVPNALTQALLADKYAIAAQTSLANYSFFMGTSNDNYDELMRTDPKNVCGIKIFMGSSTGNMLVDEPHVLEKVFANAPCLIATHCEDEATIKYNTEKYRKEAPIGGLGASFHPLVRNEAACYKSSSFAVALAKKHNTRLHILHISTGEETELFEAPIGGLGAKRITAEACVHHLWFSADDYERLGNQIKCNPAIKAPRHRERILQALLDNRIDVIATDHAPHTWAEKQQPYWQAPSGLPLVQHSLNMMLEFVREGKISITRVVEKMSHAVADCFEIDRRGYIREGYWADLVLVDLNQTTTVQRDNVLYQCGWSPLEGTTFHSCVTHTIVSGHLAYAHGQFDESQRGQRLAFVR
ncbi:MAG: dihydroorotase [Runella slithyformis]|nr:MAG: dihydroorotase [Runella slithyformis]TAF97413.1 MAG: dihydroorotase [Runella sp.]TAG22220.1 MAG: dihydroorotase [Cytophagales bacterium]TAG41309.1 MAG: dihydroorotase [Cytophagia bacterium]TAF00213.1 MAG: dihydroorotase [Runella slithyformis]